MHRLSRAWLPTVFHCLAALSCFCLPALARSSDAEPAVRAGYIEFPPYSYTDQQGQAAGDMIDLVRLLAERAGYRVEFIYNPSFRLFRSLESGQIELWATVVNHPILSPHVLQSRYRLTRLKLNLYYLGATEPQLPQALRGSRLLLMQGFVYPNSPLTPIIEDPSYNIIKVQAPTHNAAVQMLQLQRADYLLNYQPPMEQAMLETGLPPPAPMTILAQDFTLAVSKRSARAARLRDDLDRALEQLIVAGQLPERFKEVVRHEPSVPTD